VLGDTPASLATSSKVTVGVEGGDGGATRESGACFKDPLGSFGGIGPGKRSLCCKNGLTKRARGSLVSRFENARHPFQTTFEFPNRSGRQIKSGSPRNAKRFPRMKALAGNV
jgi:hypothetical protein